MAERRREKTDRGAVVERMTGRGMLGHPPLADRKHPCLTRLPRAEPQIVGECGREEDIAGLIAVANDVELHLATVPADE